MSNSSDRIAVALAARASRNCGPRSSKRRTASKSRGPGAWLQLCLPQTKLRAWLRSHRVHEHKEKTMKNAQTLTALLAIGALCSFPVFGESPEPLTVSPGATDRVTGVEARCPTFSWQAVPGAVGYEVVVYEMRDRRDTAISGSGSGTGSGSIGGSSRGTVGLSSISAKARAQEVGADRRRESLILGSSHHSHLTGWRVVG
jgi:hypothetical protein